MTTKILKNQKSPAADIELRQPGVTVPASGIYVVESLEYSLWTTTDVIDEITPFLNSGDIVVNDGVRDLTATEAIRYLEKVETVDIQKNGVDVVKSPNILNFADNLTVTNDGNGKATVRAVVSNGEDEGEQLIQVRCVSGGDPCITILDAVLLIDQTPCFLKKVNC